MNSPSSLRKRFFANTALVVAAVMSLSAFVVEFSYVRELEKSTREKLQLHIFTLLSVAHKENGRLHVPTILYNPRFNTVDSGLWAMVLDEQQKPLWSSLSIEGYPDTVKLSQKTGAWHFDYARFGDKSFITASYQIVWEEQNHTAAYHFIVAEDESSITDIMWQFRLWLAAGFALTTITLLLSQYSVLRHAFRPISELESEIALMEQGKLNALSDQYPKELSGVTHNLNALIDKEHRQRERYRASMADLAHSLKTPMAIINTEVESTGGNATLHDAVKRIDNCIEYQLRRAVISGHSLVNQGTEIDRVLQMVLEALDKVYRDKPLRVKTRVQDGQLFFGDENDLMEILGNLLDNAYKHACSAIHIAVVEANKQLILEIEDDGPGLGSQDANNIFNRGARLDQRNLGQGIGLAVVGDIVNSYGGKIETGGSRLGGALFRVIFTNRGIRE